MNRVLLAVLGAKWVVVPRLCGPNPSPTTWDAWRGMTGPQTVSRWLAVRRAAEYTDRAASTGHAEVTFVARRLPFDPANAPLSHTAGHDQ